MPLKIVADRHEHCVRSIDDTPGLLVPYTRFGKGIRPSVGWAVSTSLAPLRADEPDSHVVAVVGDSLPTMLDTDVAVDAVTDLSVLLWMVETSIVSAAHDLPRMLREMVDLREEMLEVVDWVFETRLHCVARYEELLAEAR